MYSFSETMMLISAAIIPGSNSIEIPSYDVVIPRSFAYSSPYQTNNSVPGKISLYTR